MHQTPTNIIQIQNFNYIFYQLNLPICSLDNLKGVESSGVTVEDLS